MKVVTVANCIPSQSYYLHHEFLASLEKYGVKPIILGWNEPWHGLMTKPRKYREWLRAHQSDDYLILCDAWDVVFAASPLAIVRDYEKKWSGHGLVWNAERNCFPDVGLAVKFTTSGTSFRYLNSGFAIGKPAAFLEMFESMDLDSIPDDHVDAAGNNVGPNDQLYIQQQFLKSLDWMALDTRGDLCQTLHGVDVEELDFSGDRIRNRETGAFPLAFHFNGAKEGALREPILRHLGLL